MSRVIYEVDQRVSDSETVTHLGRNGVGKTTLLRTIVGLHPLSQGKVFFDLADITMLPPFERARRGNGYVPLGRGIFPHLSVEENLVVGLAALSGRRSAKQ